MRVRIAQATSTSSATSDPEPMYGVDILDSVRDGTRTRSDTLVGSDDKDNLSPTEKQTIDKIGEALARLGRNKRVGLGVKEKREFVRAWAKSHKLL